MPTVTPPITDDSDCRGYKVRFNESWEGSIYKANRHCWMATLTKKQKNRALVIRPGKNFPNPTEAKKWCEEQFELEEKSAVPYEQKLRDVLVAIRKQIEETL